MLITGHQIILKIVFLIFNQTFMISEFKFFCNLKFNRTNFVKKIGLELNVLLLIITISI